MRKPDQFRKVCIAIQNIPGQGYLGGNQVFHTETYTHIAKVLFSSDVAGV
jgi:hypothetical protein